MRINTSRPEFTDENKNSRSVCEVAGALAQQTSPVADQKTKRIMPINELPDVGMPERDVQLYMFM